MFPSATTKSADAFRTISEVSDDLDIPQHVLRFWETRFTTIRPLKRGGGRRYYRPDDVDLLKGIRQLLYGQGYTIKGVQRILKEDGPRHVQAIGRGDALAASAPLERPDAEVQAVEGPAATAYRDISDDDPRVLEPAAAASTANESADARGSVDAGDLDRLRSALDELLECQRVLATLKRA